MKSSDAINEIALAMAKAQGTMKPAAKDAKNPFYNSYYSDISSIWESIRIPLSTNGITVLQDVTNAEKGIAIVTRLCHSSGQWIEFGPLTVPLSKQDAHGIGSAISYAKRYALSAAVGVVSSDEDDDGNSAIDRSNPKVKELKNAKIVDLDNEDSKLNKEQLNDIMEGTKKIDNECFENCLNWMKKAFNTQDFAQLPQKAYQPIMKAIKNNIEMNKQKVTVNENH